MDKLDNRIYPILAVICTLCVVSVTVAHIVDVVNSQSREDSNEAEEIWAGSIDDLNKYGGTIYYGTAGTLTLNSVKSFTGETSYKSNYSTSQSGTYGYKVSVTKALLIVEWKSYGEDVKYTGGSGGSYTHTVKFQDNSMSIPIDSIRSISVSHIGTK